MVVEPQDARVRINPTRKILTMEADVIGSIPNAGPNTSKNMKNIKKVNRKTKSTSWRNCETLFIAIEFNLQVSSNEES